MKARRIIATVVTLLVITGLVPIAFAADPTAQVGRYIVMLKEQPDVSRARSIANIKDRRLALYDIARSTADRTQGGVLAALQNEQKLGKANEVRSLKIVNAVTFQGQRSVASSIALRPDVERVSVDEIIRLPLDVMNNQTQLWNIDRVRVREVWDEGFSGAGITIGTIDTGAQASHPALLTKYRGYSQSAFNNDFNWFDPVGFSNYPNDDNGHGTHVLGTILGGDGPAPGTASDIGLAYGARWIGAKAFASDGTGLTSNVLLSMEWMQFPTDLHSAQVRPDKAPDIINNSWSAPGGCRIWFSGALAMWRAANIFPVFAAGDDPSQVHSPADDADAFAVGATDPSDARATAFSPWGTGCLPETHKPDVYAPGVGIYSSVPTNNYTQKSGTSMSAPHVSGAAALMLQAAGGPGLVPADTKQLDYWITSTAVPCLGLGDPTCRRLDVAAAVAGVRHTGVLKGTVKDTGAVPIAGANVLISGGISPITTSTTSDANGNYAILNLEGTYDVTATATGFLREIITGVNVPTGTTTTLPIVMTLAPRRLVEGTVTYWGSGDPAAGATVEIQGTTLTAIADSVGHYSFPQVPDPSIPDSVAPGAYDYIFTFKGNGCSLAEDRFYQIADSGPNVLDVTLGLKRDTFGYSCEVVPMQWVGGTDVLPLRGDDIATTIQLPFSFPFYEHSDFSNTATSSGRPYETVYVNDNGTLRFDVPGGNEFLNRQPPDLSPPNAAIYALWDDLSMDSSSQMLTSSTDDTFTIEWRNMTFHHPNVGRITFSATLNANGDIDMRYLLTSGAPANGSSADIGLENSRGTIGFSYSHNLPKVYPGLQISWSPAAQPGYLKGNVSSTSGPLPGARITATDGGGLPRSILTDPTGNYRVRLQAGGYSVSASKFQYATQTTPKTILYGGITIANFVLLSAPGFVVTGTVTDTATSAGVPYMPVTLNNIDIPDAIADTSGVYNFPDVPAGAYLLAGAGTGRCRTNPSRNINVTGNAIENLGSTHFTDAFGYHCEDAPPIGWIPGDTPTTLAGGSGTQSVALPFPFGLYGVTSTSVFIAVDGLLSFGQANDTGVNTSIPTSAHPNLSIYPFWDDLTVYPDSSILTRSASNFFAVEWRNVGLSSDPLVRMTFEVVIHPDGKFELQYLTIDPATAGTGTSATVGMENSSGAMAFSYSFNQAALSSGRRIAFEPPLVCTNCTPNTNGTIVGTVLENPTNAPIQSVDITVGDGFVTQTAVTSAVGGYSVSLPPGTYSLFASKSGFQPRQFTGLVVTTLGVLIFDFNMTRIPIHTLSGLVRDQDNQALAGFEFRITNGSNVNQPVVANSTGAYSVTLASGNYDIIISGSGRCQQPATLPVTLNLTQSYNITVILTRSDFGYACLERTLGTVHGTAFIPLPPMPLRNAVARIPIPLPFDFPMYDGTSKVAYASTDGSIIFDSGLEGVFGPQGPTMNVFKDPTLQFDDSSNLYISAPDSSTFIIEWRGALLTATSERVSFEVILRSDGTFDFQYATGTTARTTGSNALISIANACGTEDYIFSGGAVGAVSPGLGVRFSKRFETLGYTPCV